MCKARAPSNPAHVFFAVKQLAFTYVWNNCLNSNASGPIGCMSISDLLVDGRDSFWREKWTCRIRWGLSLRLPWAPSTYIFQSHVSSKWAKTVVTRGDLDGRLLKNAWQNPNSLLGRRSRFLTGTSISIPYWDMSQFLTGTSISIPYWDINLNSYWDVSRSSLLDVNLNSLPDISLNSLLGRQSQFLTGTSISIPYQDVNLNSLMGRQSPFFTGTSVAIP